MLRKYSAGVRVDLGLPAADHASAFETEVDPAYASE